MSNVKPVRFGLSVTGLALAVVSVIVSCTDAPVSPKSGDFSIKAPVALVNTIYNRFQFLGFVTDDAGANDTPAQSDLNAFTRADNLPDTIGVKWVWDDVDSWTGSGQTGDACALFDTDADKKANSAVCVRITNPGGDPTQIGQLDPGSPLVYTCGDTKNDRCTQSVSGPLAGTSCEVEKITGETFFTAGEDGADVLAACAIPLAAIAASGTPDLLNVCSYPSGSPNSNPFDCVVTPGAGFLVIKKATSPQSSGVTFNFKVNPRVIADSLFSITDNSSQDEATAILAASPGNYSVTELALSSGWALDSAACVQSPSTGTGTKSGSTVSSVAIASGKTTTCRFVNKIVAPSITVVKTATPDSIPETGGSVSFGIVVTNGAAIPVTLDSLVDNVFGNLSTQGTCNSGGNPYGSIAVGGTYSCSVTKTLGASNAGQVHIDSVRAKVSSAGGPASATDSARVRYTDVKPDISVSKSADYTSIAATGGDSVSGFVEDAKFARGQSGAGGGAIFASNICDDAGANDEPAQSDLNCFSRSDNVSGRLGLRWTWDDINSWTGTGQTGDACALLDTNNNGSANFAFCVRIYNPGGDPNTIAQVSPGSPILYKCKDSQPDRCASPNSEQSIDVSTTCTVKDTTEAMAGGDDGQDVQALCDLRLQDLGNNITIANVDLLNVCSFPSGSPGSNNFDCVVLPAAGFLVITESTTPANADAYFAFTLRNAGNTGPDSATNGDSKWEVQGGASSPGLPLVAGNHALVQGLPTNWTLGTIVCTKDGQTVGTSDIASLAKLQIPISAGQTTTCTFTNSLTASQVVTFTVTVTNNSLEAVNLFSLEDSENPDAGTPTYSTLSGSGTCNATGNLFGSIAGSGGTYSCTFTRTVSGSPGTQHKDKVKAVGKDNENNPDTEFSNKVTVTIN